MLKVIYFDESSALDSIDQKNEGRVKQITKEMIEKAHELTAGTKLEGSASTGFFSLLKVSLGMDAKGNLSNKGNNILTSTLTNTILTSFISYMKTEKRKSGIETLKDYRLRIVPDSFTFLKTLTPFIKVFSNQADMVVLKDSSSQQNDQQNIDFSLMDDVLSNAKGYYEFLADNGTQKKVVRFNLDGLRNNYRLTDLQKMNLTIYGIKVGSCKEESLNFEYEIGTKISQNNNNSQIGQTGFNAFEQNDKYNPIYDNELDIIDVILAGIE